MSSRASAAERFDIRRKLGEGSFGVVFEAWDRERDQPVALKRLRSLQPGALRRFKREFRVFADVVHPNVVRLGELMQDHDDWFFTMELIEGSDLLSYVHGTATGAPAPSTLDFASHFDEPRLRDAFAQLVNGVSALHARGLLHRDLKPTNVIVNREGRVVVLDFGLGRELSEGVSQHTATMAGTPAYISPEECGDGVVTQSSDWYSVGVMLYEALTGILPFRGSMIQMMSQRMTAEPPAPRRVSAAVPADLDTLCRDLMRLDPAARPGAVEIMQRLRETQVIVLPDGAQGDADEVFVGRAAQLGALHDALNHARNGEAAVVFIDGESGMGKTALARHFIAALRESDADALVLAGRCYERESVPFKAFDSVVDALSRYLDRLPQQEAAALLPEDWPALERLFPVLRDLGTSLWTGSGSTIADAQELRRRGFEALRELLRRLAARHTLVLFIDDLQWGDIDSGNLLRELTRAPNAPPLMLLATYRREDTTASPLLRMLSTSTQSSRRWQIAIDALSPEEARTLARTRLGEAARDAIERADALARESQGSPFFVDALARYQLAGPPAASAQLRLESAIHARVAQLPDGARRLLEIVAVAGRPMELEVANQAAGLDPRDQRAAELLYAEKWVRHRAGMDRRILEMYHDRMRETIAASVPPERLPSYHNRLATALLASGVADAETLAEHYRSAGELELAGRHALRAADQARDALAFDRAARLYALTLELWQPQDDAQQRDIHLRLAQALVNTGRGADAARHFLIAAKTTPIEQAFEMQRAAAEQLLLSGHIDDGLVVLRRLLRTVGLQLARSPLHALRGIIASRALLLLRGLKWRPRRASEVDAALLRRIDVAASVAIGLGMIDIMQRQRFQAVNMLLSLRAGEPHRVARALMIEMAISSAGGTRTLRRTRRLQEMCRDIVDNTDQPYTHGFFAVMSGIVAYLCDDFAGAVELSRRGQQLLSERCTGVAWELDTAYVFELLGLLQLGRWQEFAQLVPARAESARARSDAYLISFFRARVSYMLHLLEDDAARARDEQSTSLVGWSRSSYQLQHYWSWHASCEIELYDGRPATAWELLRGGMRSFRLSLLPFMTQTIRIENALLGARIALSLAQSPASDAASAQKLARVAEKHARQLEREKVATASSLALLVRAGVAAVRTERAAALSLCNEAEAALEAVGSAHMARAALWLGGHLEGGAAGARRRAAAEDWMAAQGARAPRRMLALLTPGCPG